MKINSKLTPIALALLGLGIGHAAPTFAGEPIEFGNDVKLDWRLNATYTVAQRVKDADAVLAGNAGSNDGDNNFKKNALVANRLGLFLDATLSKGKTGFVMSASSFYDDVYHKTNDNITAVNKPGAANEFTDQARYFHGGYSRLLDAYGYTTFDIGTQSHATVRLGKHVVSWGEGLFFPGISLTQGPADGTKTGVPGTETKDQLLPEDQISVQVEVTPNWSLLAHAQYNWHETQALAPGSFLSTSDGVGQGGSCLGPYANVPAFPGVFGGFSGCSFGARQDDIRPDKTGQWGIGSRYRVTDETEVGVYYLNYQDRTPIPEINAFARGVATPAFYKIPGNQIGNGTYRIRYFDDIKLLGATFSTVAGASSIAGEISFKQGAPVLVNTVVDPTTRATLPTPTRADIMQANVNTYWNLGRSILSPQTLLLGELAYVKVSNIEARKAPGVESLGPAAAFFPATDVASFGTSGLAAAITLSLTYPGIFDGWELGLPISYSQQLKGRTLLGGVGGEGDKRYSVSATFTYNRNFSIGLSYLGYLGEPENGAVPALLKSVRQLTDRDQMSLVMKYSF